MNPEYFNRITAKYGLSAEAFLDLFARQGHKCASCSIGLVLFSDTHAELPVVDHCHATGKVRGILCHSCNIRVGFLEKDEWRTVACAEYLMSCHVETKQYKTKIARAVGRAVSPSEWAEARRRRAWLKKNQTRSGE